MSVTLEIRIQGPVLAFNPRYPLPQTLPIAASKVLTLLYGQLSGSSRSTHKGDVTTCDVNFGTDIVMGWLLYLDKALDQNETEALKAQGWTLTRRVWHLVDKTIRIPRATERPENWPPSHLKVVERGVKMYGVRSMPHVDYVSVMDSSVPRDWGFYATQDRYPVVPFRTYGKIRIRGWDIPTCYAIDGNGRCWKDDAHGPSLAPCSVEDLLAEFETSEERNEIRQHLGMKPEMPDWMKRALAAGWTPPVGWSASSYEE